MCDNVKHNLEEIFRTCSDSADVDIVVRWCKDCGAVVVDREMDGTTYAGDIVKMKFPTYVGINK